MTFLTDKINPKTIILQKEGHLLYIHRCCGSLTDFMCHFVENDDSNCGKQMQGSVFSTFERVNRSVVLSDVLFFLCYSETREYT